MKLDLSGILQRLEEYSEKAVFEVDIDIQELEELNAMILSSEEQMTTEMAVALKKNIDELLAFVDHQKGIYRKVLTGMSTGKKAIGQYKGPTLKTKSKFVYRRA